MRNRPRRALIARARRLAEFRRTPPSMFPSPREFWPDLAVESGEAFDVPAYREPIPPRYDPAWLRFFIGKSLAGCDVRDPSPQEFVGWFQPGHILTPVEGSIIDTVMGELHRHGGMPWLWKLSRTLGVSIRDIARTMREAGVHSGYPCLWINEYAWSRHLPAGLGHGGRGGR